MEPLLSNGAVYYVLEITHNVESISPILIPKLMIVTLLPHAHCQFLLDGPHQLCVPVARNSSVKHVMPLIDTTAQSVHPTPTLISVEQSAFVTPITSKSQFPLILPLQDSGTT